MSGKHYNYAYQQLEALAAQIEEDFANEGKYKTSEWPNTAPYPGRNKTLTYDRLEDANATQREFLLVEINSLIHTLKECAHRAKELEWYLSGDTDVQTYINNIS